MKKLLLLIVLSFITLTTFAIPTLQQTAYRWRNDDGGETSATWKAPINTGITISDPDELIRLRLNINTTGGTAGSTTTTVSNLYYAESGGAWVMITDDPSNDFVVESSSFVAHGEETTAQTGVSGAFEPGHIVSEDDPDLDLYIVVSSNTEYEWVIKPTANCINLTSYTFKANVTNLNVLPTLNTDFAACSPIASVIVSNDGAKCAGENIQLMGTSSEPGSSFSWTGPGGFTSSDENPLLTSVTTAMSGWYVLTVTTSGGCETIDSTEVTVHPMPGVISLSVSDTTICPNTPFSITATGGSGGTFDWWPIGGTVSGSLNENYEIILTTTPSQKFVASVTNIFGCTQISDTTIIRNSPSPTGIFSMSPTSCGGDDGYIMFFGLKPSEDYYLTYNKDGMPLTSTTLTSNPTGTLTYYSLDAGDYTDIYIVEVETGCTSYSPMNVTLYNPTSPIPYISDFSHPSTCGGINGSIEFSGLEAGKEYSITYEKDGTPSGPDTFTTNTTGQYLMEDLIAGVYTNIIITRLSSGCSSATPLSQTLANPAAPFITWVSTEHPTTCGGEDGEIIFSGLLPFESYTIDYILEVVPGLKTGVADGSGQVYFSDLAEGEYTSIIITNSSSCASNVLDESLNGPPVPTLSIVSTTDPSTCGGDDGEIVISGLAPLEMCQVEYKFNGIPVSTSILTNTSGDLILNDLLSGDYDSISVTNANECTGIYLSTSLEDPVPPTVSSIDSISTSGCGAIDGGIVFNGLTPLTVYSVSVTYSTIPLGSLVFTTDAMGSYTLEPLGAGLYSDIIITELATGCSSASMAITIEDGLQDSIVVSPSETIQTCEGDVVELEASGGALSGIAPIYSWTPTTDLFIDASLSTPYVGENVSTVYAALSGDIDYTVTATVGSCFVDKTVSLEVKKGSNSVALSDNDQNGISLTEACEYDGWIYYTDPSLSEAPFLFGIEWGANNDDARSAAVVTIQLDAGAYEAEDMGSQRATYTLNRYWNVDIGTEVLVDPVNVRFFYDEADLLALEGMAADFALASGGAVETPTWFKTDGLPFSPDASSITEDGILNAIPLVDVSGGATLNGVHYAQFNGIESFSGGTYATGVGINTPLNVQLGDFTARNEGDVNRVSWNTLSEEQDMVFHLEKSTDGRSFEQIAKVPGKGTASQYTHLDRDPVKGYNYYRLNMVGVNGKRVQSGIVYVWIDASMNNSMTVFPNPADKEVTIRIEGQVSKDAQIQITDLSGRVIEDIRDIRGNEVKVNLESYAQGVYLIKYKDGNFSHTVKVTKQ